MSKRKLAIVAGLVLMVCMCAVLVYEAQACASPRNNMVCATAMQCTDYYYPCYGKHAGAECYNCAGNASRDFCVNSAGGQCNHKGSKLSCGAKSLSYCVKESEVLPPACMGGFPESENCYWLDCTDVPQ